MARHCTGEKFHSWNAVDDKNWIEGKVSCPLGVGGFHELTKYSVWYKYRSLEKSLPPRWCPFPLEHCVMEG